jgi:hypothetical protein
MVARLLVSLSDGNVGGSVLSCRNCTDQRRCALSILQLVGLTDIVSRRHRFTDVHSIISFLGTVAIATSLAEIASIWPTAGGRLNLLEWECSIANRIRSISLGRCPRSREKPSCCILVYWLDFNRWSDCSHRIRSLCWWITVPSTHHVESSRYIRS